MRKYLLLFFLCLPYLIFSQRDSLNLGDRYAEDQIYFSVNYALLDNQTSQIENSGFSYALSAGFIKDIILNKQGNISVAFGLGYGFDYFNQNLKVEQLNDVTTFNIFQEGESGIFRSHNIEIPFEIRWRTSNAKLYKYWRIYAGMKFLYNTSNEFITETSDTQESFKNVSAYNDFQYGLTLSVGYDLFNFNVFYGLKDVFEGASFNNQNLDTRILKFGLIFYIL